MEHFCTLFDINFLPQGMALHASLQRHAGDFVLWVLCMDDKVEDALKRLELPHVRLIPLRDIETPALLAIKPGRSRAEYCWTLTPFLPQAVIDRDLDATRVTYVDADCWFISDPRRILKEMDEAQADVLITPHAYLPEHDQSRVSGVFCVQFVPFRRTAEGLKVLASWQEQCLAWCFSGSEEGRFGDQKYLDHWPEKFLGTVYILQNTQLTMAPWNAPRYKEVRQFDQDGCMYHFHGLRVFKEGWICLCLGGMYRLPENILRDFYQSYLNDLQQSIKLVFDSGLRLELPSVEMHLSVYAHVKSIYKRVFKNEKQIWRRI